MPQPVLAAVVLVAVAGLLNLSTLKELWRGRAWDSPGQSNMRSRGCTHTLAGMADELIAMRIQFHAVEPRSAVRDRLRREGVDGKLGGIDRFTTVADVIDHFLGEPALSPIRIKSSF